MRKMDYLTMFIIIIIIKKHPYVSDGYRGKEKQTLLMY